MPLHDDCLTLFGHTNLYKIFGIKKADTQTNIKKAYYKLALAYHPDRFTEDEKKDNYHTANKKQKSIATRKFQVIGQAYQILSDPDKKKIYDETGSLDENDSGDTNWYELFRNMFPKVNEKAIEEYMKTYFESEIAMEDVKKAYIKCKGNINMMYEYVIGLNVDTEETFREMVWHLINTGAVKPYRAFTDERPTERQKRIKKAAKERKEADEYLKTFKSKWLFNEHMALEDSLVEQIQRAGVARQQRFAQIFTKYGGVPDA